jgi:hypothetical protein
MNATNSVQEFFRGAVLEPPPPGRRMGGSLALKRDEIAKLLGGRGRGPARLANLGCCLTPCLVLVSVWIIASERARRDGRLPTLAVCQRLQPLLLVGTEKQPCST